VAFLAEISKTRFQEELFKAIIQEFREIFLWD
jgi:hypothetical protein